MTPPAQNLRTIMNEDGAVILDIERDSMSTLNPTGAYVWHGLQRGDSLETIVGNLARETGERVLVIERDVHEFVQDLKDKRLLSR